MSKRFTPLIAAISLLSLGGARAYSKDFCDTGFDFGSDYSAAKNDLMQGRYEEFFEKLSLASGTNLARESTGASKKLRDISDDGFHTCKPIITKRHSDSFITEVVAYYNGASIIYLLTDAIMMDDAWIIVRFRVTSSFDEISEMLY